MAQLHQDTQPGIGFVERLLRPIDRNDGLDLRPQLAVFGVVLLAIVSRLPGAFLHPQFFAEDGWAWYQQAYNLHWMRSLFVPQAGYMQTLPRLITGITFLLPMLWAPFVMNLSGAIIQALPVTALLSRRCTSWGTLSTRLAMAVVYLAIADASEIHVVLTNAMWHLALLQAILAFASPPRNATQRLADILLFTIGGLTGPFCLLLFLPVLAYWWVRRHRWTLAVLGLLAAAMVIQAVTILHSVRATAAPLGATPLSFMRLVGGNIVVDSMTGTGGPLLPGKVLLLAFLCGMGVLWLGWRHASLPMRLYMVFAVIATGACLRDPLVSGSDPRWWVISQMPGLRYWFFPSLMFLWAAIWCATNRHSPPARLCGCVVLLLTLFGDGRSWRYPSWPDSHLAYYVERLRDAKPGEHVIFPIYPNGAMDLIKR